MPSFPIRAEVPYRLTIEATDLASGKRITNALWYKSLGLFPSPGYGVPLAGSDQATFVSSARDAWLIVKNLLNHNYQTVSYTSEALIGKRYGSPTNAIAALISSLGVIVQTTVPHGLVTGATVNVLGVNTPAAANGVWSITVLSPLQFQLNGSAAFTAWSGDGYWQLATGTPELMYTDKYQLFTVAVGGIAGDALPLFASASVRRINGGSGRHFRSRLSLSPMSEADSLDGGWIPATKTAWDTALALFHSTIVSNGATDPGAAIMFDLAVSTTLALGLATPFAQSDSFTSLVTSYKLQRNAGSIVRRKPRLTIPIS